jgi:hypothetical protein
VRRKNFAPHGLGPAPRLDIGYEGVYDYGMIRKMRRSPEAQRRVESLRRSNAAQPHKNKTTYSRKVKHKNFLLVSVDN